MAAQKASVKIRQIGKYRVVEYGLHPRESGAAADANRRDAAASATVLSLFFLLLLLVLMLLYLMLLYLATKGMFLRGSGSANY